MPRWNLLPVAADEMSSVDRVSTIILWPLLAIAVGLIIWTIIRKRKLARSNREKYGDGTNGTGTNSGTKTKPRKNEPPRTWTKPEDYREHHEVAWSGDPEHFSPSELDWPLAVSAVMGICSGDPWDELRFANLDSARTGLREAWQIRSREELLAQLHWLLREGHRVGFDDEIAEWRALDNAAAERLHKQLASSKGDEAKERAWRMQQVLANTRGIRGVRFEAWDLARAAMLCRASYSLGWLIEDEAVDTLNLISAQLQRTYSGWEELGKHFTLAQWYWGGSSDLRSKQEDAHSVSRQAALLDPKRGPWAYVVWNRLIPESGLLLVEALVSEGIVTELPAPAPTPLAQVIDDATAARLTT
ncbi:MAG: DUF1266 domain-containing protein [Leucobacter sp.]